MSATTLERMPARLLAIGAAALAGCALWAWWNRAALFEGYLVAWLFFVAISAGSMANLMIHDLTGGRWGAVLRPPLEAATAAMPLLALLGVPLVLGLADLYPWAAPGADADPALAAKHWYLNVPFFCARAVVILGAWSALALALRRDWRARRVNPAPKPERRISIAGLILYFITVTVAAIDWVGSLVPAWYSSAIGLRVGVAQTLAGFAFAVPAATWLLPDRSRHEQGEASARDRQDLGNLLMMFVMVWAYIAFTEFLIIWAEDIPRETAWFLPRATSWRWVALVLAFVEFAVPMVATLFRAVKRHTRPLAALCLLVLAGQWLDTLWLVVPSLRPQGFRIGVPDVLATIGIGGVWLAYALRAVESAPPAPLPVPEVAPHA